MVLIPTSGTLEDINTGDFSGAVGEGDILRFTDSELAIIDINTTSPQRFVITDGADSNPVEQFVVDSTNGNTTILGDVTVNANFTLAGSTTEGSQVLTITTGGSSPVTTLLLILLLVILASRVTLVLVVLTVTD